MVRSVTPPRVESSLSQLSESVGQDSIRKAFENQEIARREFDKLPED